jgi:hypothetical protein
MRLKEIARDFRRNRIGGVFLFFRLVRGGNLYLFSGFFADLEKSSNAR